ncbi:MAG: hypothetical protein WDN00_03595 [Limisphaerales bacterium]
MTQSVSPSEASLCQTSRAEWPSSADGVDGVLVAVAGGELEDGKIHGVK